MQRYFRIVLRLTASALLVATAGAQKSPAPSIPLCPGLTVVTAVNGSTGDYESIKTIESTDAKEVHLKYSAESMVSDPLASAAPVLKQTNLHRTILISDLSSARSYEQKYLEKSEEKIPGTTAIGTSQAILRAPKAGSEVEMKIDRKSVV